MKSLRFLFKDKFLLLAAFFILLPSGFKLCLGVEGQIFVASPNADNPDFDHTVLYMFHHTIDGAGALILNRDYPLSKHNKIPSLLSKQHIPLYWGGPVNDETDIFVLEWNGDNQKPKIMLFDRLVAEDIDILNKIEKRPDKYRIYLGSSNWQSLQYEMERISNIWILGASRAETLSDIFSTPTLNDQAIWLKTLKNSNFYKKQAILNKISA